MAALFASTAKGTGWHRPKYLARVLRAGSSTDALILEANCEVAARLVDRLGHRSVAFTLQQYAHVLPQQQAEAAERLAERIYGPRRSRRNPADPR